MIPIEIQSMQYGQCRPNVLLRSPPSYITLSEERRENTLSPHVTCIEDITEAFIPSHYSSLSSMSLNHPRSEAGLDVGLDSGETEKATLAGLGCGMGVERLPGVYTVSSKFSSSTKAKSFRWSGRGRGGLNVCSLERAESFQVSQPRVFQGQSLFSI